MHTDSVVLGPGTFYGSLEPLHDTERVRLITSRHEPGEQLPRHVHVSAYLSFVIRGGYDESAWGSVITRDTFTLRFHPAGEEHEDRFGGSGALCLNIQLLEGWEETIDRLGLDKGLRTVKGSAPAILDLYRHHEVGHVDAALALEEATVEFLQKCARVEREDLALMGSAALRRARSAVRDMLPGSVSLTAVAAAARVHPTHLARLFKARLGYTLSAYVRACRLESAQRFMARHPRWHLSMVAAEHGFADHAHFTRTFRDECGMSPRHFKALLPLN